MKVRKLIIVDDEKNIRLGLKTMIEREYPSAYHIELASNGQMALELNRAARADLILTDIRMPVLDGIRLLEELDRETGGRKPAVVLLSGYDDFEYAKTAIRYKVKDYLLKPIQRTELFDMLNRVDKELSELEAANLERTQEKHELQMEQRKNRLRQLLFGRGPVMEEELQQAARILPASSYAVAMVLCRYVDGSVMPTGEIQRLVERLSHSMDVRAELVLTDIEGRLILAGNTSDWYQELARQAEEKGWNGFRIGISTEQNDLAQVREQYLEAQAALRYTFLHPSAYYIEYDAALTNRMNYPLPYGSLRKLGNMLGTDRVDEMKKLLASIFELDHLKQMDMTYLEKVSGLINENVFDEVFRKYGESSVEVLKMYRLVGSLNNFQSFNEYYRKLEYLLVSVNDYVSRIRLAHSEHADMKEAVRYIQEHYERPLNMAMVSNHVSLNYSYFSEAFKAYTGDNFVSYLKKVRIQRAKELLLNKSTMKMAEISLAVGFENSKQFSRVFKELEGVSPHEYRQLGGMDTERGE
ncbi:response regulator [Paenibacillus urinalis]|uniref:Response regulator n=1 Tax=Paenibacillus urinalis TaxID=521520 RepID=A0AAX3N1T3_9BACL|nr:response regulator [Paenibacillus urinalis]WDH83492.1 response regulator [Paenibacillus urinalis]